MKKLFISQPMNGKSEAEILKERDRLFNFVKTTTFTREDNTTFDFKNEEIELIDTFFKEEDKPMAMLGKSIQLLAEADIACFAEGWREARGCKIEHDCAKQYGISLIIEE